MIVLFVNVINKLQLQCNEAIIWKATTIRATVISVVHHGLTSSSYLQFGAVADPGFPLGGRGPPRRLHYEILYVKTKESGPVGGGRAPGTPPLNPPMQRDVYIEITILI